MKKEEASLNKTVTEQAKAMKATTGEQKRDNFRCARKMSTQEEAAMIENMAEEMTETENTAVGMTETETLVAETTGTETLAAEMTETETMAAETTEDEMTETMTTEKTITQITRGLMSLSAKKKREGMIEKIEVMTEETTGTEEMIEEAEGVVMTGETETEATIGEVTEELHKKERNWS